MFSPQNQINLQFLIETLKTLTKDLQTIPWDTIKLFDDIDNGTMDLFISTDRR